MRNKIVRLDIPLLTLWVLTGMACSSPNNEENSEFVSEPQSDSDKFERQGIDFIQGSFEKALALASANEKLIFVFISDNDLGPSVVMEETVFSSPDVSSYINEKFVSYKVDLTDETQDGPKLESPLEGVSWPTYLLIDSDGKTLSRATRSVRPNQFLLMINRMLGQSPSTFEALESRYDSGERSPEFIQQYLMDAILELAFHHVRDEPSAQQYFEKGSQYKSVAREYFASKDHSELINETDAHLILFYWENHQRGDELVEFVLEHYEEFLAVSSEVAMADFTLRATYSGAMFAAADGDELYIDYIEALESDPLRRAADYERRRDPNSDLLPERMKYSAGTSFYWAKRDWDAFHETYEKLFQEWGEKTPVGAYATAAVGLGMSDNQEHLVVAADYARKAYELSGNERFYTETYISALVKVGNVDEAKRIADEYRAGLSESEVDVRNLELFDSISSPLLDQNNEASKSGD